MKEVLLIPKKPWVIQLREWEVQISMPTLWDSEHRNEAQPSQVILRPCKHWNNGHYPPWEERPGGTLRKGKSRVEKKASLHTLLLELMFKLDNASITWDFLENQIWAFHCLGNYVAWNLWFWLCHEYNKGSEKGWLNQHLPHHITTTGCKQQEPSASNFDQRQIQKTFEEKSPRICNCNMLRGLF